MNEQERVKKELDLKIERLKAELGLGQDSEREKLLAREMELKFKIVETVADHWQSFIVAIVVVLSIIYYIGFFVGRSVG